MMPDGMAEALRLTRAGRLAEATALIQRSLAGPPARTTPSGNPANPDEPIEGTFRVVGQQPALAGTPETAPAEETEPDTTAGQGRLELALGSRRPGVVPAPAASGPVRAPAPAHTVAQPRESFIGGSYSNSAGSRTYRLCVPSGYAGQAVPLVVVLHGCTQTAADCATGTRLNALAEEETFLVAYPEQAAAANRSRCWNWFKRSNQQRDRGEPSLIAGITQQVMTAYSVDPRRVYVAGMSAGGAMAAIMGAMYPDLYAAVGIHSGLAHGAARDLESALTAMRQGGPDPAGPGDLNAVGSLPTIVFHGDCDRTVHPRNGEQVLAQALPRPAGDAQGSANAAESLVSASRGQVPGGHAYTRSVYRDAGGHVVGERWVVHGAGHAWSGGSPAGSFTDPRGPDASKEMLRFFREHPRAEPASRPAD
jgi:poly(hydroxyalkanoate) depolymerase family esterase